jgi:flavin reductase (DIM6/NTAB) family NADH-FMN oxidoreductase RutF
MTPRPVDAAQMREAGRNWLTGVAVLSVIDSTGSQWGMTISSLASVSNDPPLISVCLASSSPCARVVLEGRRFGISVLAASQDDLARRFSAQLSDKFADLPLVAGPSVPILDGCVTWFECQARDQIEAGDHVIVIGHVIACASGEDAPLGYLKGNFLDLGGVGVTALDRQRRTLAGWLVDVEGGVALSARSRNGRPVWSLPQSIIPRAATTHDALARSARIALSIEPEVHFLYSIVDVQDEQATLFVYRGVVDVLPPGNESLRVFAEHEVPWDSLDSGDTVSILQRYFQERQTGRFAIYLHIGEGKLARMESP